MERVVGIDFGFNNCRVAVYENNVVKLIENGKTTWVFPSVVTFQENMVLVGDDAVDELHRYPKTTISGILHLIGLKFDSPSVRELMNKISYTIFDDLGWPKIKIQCSSGDIREYYPEEISACILRYLKNLAEKQLSQAVTKAVVTVPAYFDDDQRRAIKDAVKLAGFKAGHLIDEPVAAALAFHHKYDDINRNILVYDFGRHKFDVSVVEVARGAFQVKATKTDALLGGVNVTANLKNFIKRDLLRQHEERIDVEEFTQRRLTSICEATVKRLFENQLHWNIELDSPLGLYEYKINISRARLEQLNRELFDRTFRIVDECLMDSGLRKEDIDEVIPIGGSSKIPKIQKMLQEYFGFNKLASVKNPEEVLVHGAAIRAAKLMGDKTEASAENAEDLC